MIARLRRRHGPMVGWVGAVALVVFLVALAVRPARPRPTSSLAYDTASWSDLGADSGLRALRERRGTREWLSVERPPDLASPDLLLYWAPVADGSVDGSGADLPLDAVLLGPLGDAGIGRFELPRAETAGDLILYSLGHDRVLLVEPLISIRLDHGR